MSTRASSSQSIPRPVPKGFNDTVPPLDTVTSAVQVNRVVASCGILPFTDQAEGYVIQLIEDWCSKHTSDAAKDLRFVLEQAKWMTGYRAFAKAALEQLPPR